MANTYLTRTFGSPSAPGGGTFKWTISFWMKKSSTNSDQTIMSRYVNSGKFVRILITNGNKIEYAVYNGGYQARYETSAVLRDTSAWYHIVIAQDSTLSTAADRVKFYINGELVTSFATNTQIGQNIGGDFNTVSAPHQIGAYNGTNFFDGLMSHFNFCDNYQYAASDFGSVDSTTGEWQINTSPSVSYGTTGFTILKDGNTITDQSSNSNNWTLGGGTLTKTEDSPSNVFATLNSLPKSGVSFSYGNLQADNQSSDWTSALATFGSSTGKWYAEFKVTDDSAGTTRNMFGVCDARDVQIMSEDELGQNTSNRIGDTVGYSGNGSGNCLKNGSDQGSGFNTTYTIGDIISVALDCTNGAVYIAKNGTYLNSGSPTSGASKTGAVTITTGETYLIGGTVYSSTYQANFGNGHFGTTAVSSAGTNASGNGIFEYDCPAGFTALSTKGLNT